MKLVIFFNLFLLLSTSLFSQQVLSAKEKGLRELSTSYYEKSIILYTKLISAKPTDYLLYKERAAVYSKLNRHSKVISDCSKALKLNPTLAHKLYLLQTRAHAYFKLKMWQKALDDLNDYTDDVDICFLKAYSLIHLNKNDEAIKQCSSILKIKNLLYTKKIYAYEALGFAYLKMDSLNKAKEAYENIISLDTLSESGFYLKGKICFYEKDFDSAIVYFNKIDPKDNNYSDAIYQIARAERKKKNYNKSANLFFKYLKLNGDSAAVFNEVAWTYYLAHNYSGGLLYANKSIQLDNKNEHAYDTRGAIYYKLKKYQKSISDFNRALTIDSTYANSLYYRGICYLKTKNRDKACMDLSSLLKNKKYELLEGEKSVELLISENCNK